MLQIWDCWEILVKILGVFTECVLRNLVMKNTFIVKLPSWFHLHRSAFISIEELKQSHATSKNSQTDLSDLNFYFKCSLKKKILMRFWIPLFWKLPLSLIICLQEKKRIVQSLKSSFKLFISYENLRGAIFY